MNKYCPCLIGSDVVIQAYINELSKCPINPIKVSQLLFSDRCINETTFDKIETLEDTLDEKKTTLLSTIQTAISSDHRKIYALTTVLSKFEETKHLSERLNSEYGKKELS